MADDDTLEWNLKINADLDGAAKADAALGKIGEHAKAADTAVEANEKAIKKLNFELEKMKAPGAAKINELNRELEHLKAHANDSGLTKIRHEFGQYGHAIAYAKNELKELAEFTGLLLLAEDFAKLTEKAIEFGEEILATAAKAERFDTSFKLALGEKPGTELLDYIERIGHHTEFTQEQLKEMNLELAKSGFKGGGLGRATEATIDLASMSANPQQGAQSAVEALRRVMTTGKLEARQLMPFGINEQTLFGELSKETGLGVKSLKKKLEAGKIDIDTTLNSLYTVITQKTGKALGGAGADMEHLFSTRLKNLKEIPDLLYEKMSKSSGFASISSWIGKIGDQFGVAGAQGEKILTALTDEVDRFGSALGGVDAGDLGSTIGDVIHLVGTLAAGTVVLIDDVASGIQRLERGYLRIKAAFGGDEAKKEYGKLQLDEERADRVKEAQAAPTYDEDMKDLDELEDMRRRAASRAAGAEKAGEEIGKATIRGTRRALDMHSPSRVMERLADETVDSFTDRVRANAGAADASISRVVSLPGRGGAGGGRGPVHFVFSPHVEVHGGGSASADEIARSLATKLRDMAVGELQSAIEQLAMQTGSAAA